MMYMLFIIMAFFWSLLLFYTVVTIAGVWFRARYQNPPKLTNYPSVAVLIPAHNEGVVIEDTMRAMGNLKYSGELNIYLLDDNSSDDTAEIVKEFSKVFSNIHYIAVPPGEPKGKSRVLNYGLSISDSEYFVVYDADNQPETDAVEKLVETAETTEKSAGAVGYVKTKNANTNFLTGMIALEFQVFQLLMQCGRWALFKLGSLAGTNMLLRRSVIEEMGGYDVYALAEDAELTVRISASGYYLPVVPSAKTWEQEPERLKTFIKQRTRWLTGNIYLLDKSIRDFSHWKGRTFFLTLQHILTYVVFILLLLFSHTFFILSIFGFDLPNIPAPLFFLWYMSYVVYTAQLISAIVMDDTVTLKNVVYTIVMYFTYAQIFIILLLRSFPMYVWSRVTGKAIGWDKTKRFKAKSGEHEET